MSFVSPVVRNVLFVAISIGFLLVGNAVAEDASPSKRGTDAARTNWYVSTVVSGRGGYRITHLWSRGAKMRSETMMGSHPITTIIRGNRYWVYDGLTGEGVEIERSPQAIAEDRQRARPFGNDLDDLRRAGGERVETSELSGIPVEVWRVTNKKGRRTVWVTASEPGLPLRVENFDRETSESATLSYSNWTSPSEIPDRFFEPPQGLRIEHFEYDVFARRPNQNGVGPLPILYPVLIHGSRPD